jgi:DNA invertase Pin-like site-specific DNA recombinase
MKYGYARVSTDDQNPALQLAALKNAGCQTVFKDEGLSGATTKRPALQRCLKKLERGDTLIVWKLDRLGRSLRDPMTMPDDLKQRGVKFRSLTEAIDTDTPTGRAMWQMIGVLAELKRSLTTERTRAGVKAAKGRGVKFGRKPKLTPQQIDEARKLLAKKKPPSREYVAEPVQSQPDHTLPGARRLGSGLPQNSIRPSIKNQHRRKRAYWSPKVV